MLKLLKNLLFLFPLLSGFPCFSMVVTKVILDKPEVCKAELLDNIFWASERKAILVIGRGSDNCGNFYNCSVIVGAASTQAGILRLNFEAFHIADCGVMVSINQSLHSNFEPDNAVMARITCGHGKVAVLHSEEKHFVKITVHKTDSRQSEYNFRINITVTDRFQDILNHSGLITWNKNSLFLSGKNFNKSIDGSLSARRRRDSLSSPVFNNIRNAMKPQEVHSSNRTSGSDKMPETGPALYVVIIVGCVMAGVVVVSVWLLVKYLIRRSQRWHELSTERTMERAIHLYNSQQVQPEPDYMYTALPCSQVLSQTRSHSSPLGHCRNEPAQIHIKKACARNRPVRTGDISFVHPDGHIETFRLRGPPDTHANGTGSNLSASHTTQSSMHTPGRNCEDSGDYVIGECPPSYEEALHMPSLADESVYANVGLRDSSGQENPTG